MQDRLVISRKGEVEFYDLDEVSSNSTIFSFNEYEMVKIKLESTNYKVQMECISFISDNTYHFTANNILYLEDGKEYLISKNASGSNELNYLPGTYQITIYKDKEVYTCYFEVLYNANLGSSGATNMIKVIENFVAGLSVDFFNSGAITSLANLNIKKRFYVHQILAHEEKKIIETLKQIESGFRFNLHNEIVLENYEKKQNAKTIRKNILNKTTKVYNVKKCSCYNTVDNIVLKKYLLKIYDVLGRKTLKLSSEIKKENENYNDLVYKQAELREKYRNAKSSSEKAMLEGAIKNNNELLNKTYEWINKMRLWNEVRHNLKEYFKIFLAKEEMKSIDVNNQVTISRSFFYNPDYLYIKKLHDLLEGDYSDYKNEMKVFSTKRTYKLFEIYGFVLIENILKELGFIYLDEGLITTDLVSETKFSFTKDNLVVQIIYDHFCDKAYQSVNDRVVSINSYHNKPDYLIKIYKDGILTNVLVFEIKYRSLAYLASQENKIDELDSTLEDYYQLAYKNSKGEVIRGVVSKLMVLYPSSDETCFVRHDIAEFIGINASLDFRDSLAYNKLKDNLVSSIMDEEQNIKKVDVDDLTNLFETLY